jgi:predicted signal transduction protein with EAL and GGDEF domain
LLQKVTGRMQTFLSRHHCVGRFGGDEFVLVLPWRANELDAAPHLLEQIRTEIARPITLGTQEVRISCSIGVAIYPEHGEDAESLLVKADLAMYRAKEAGKNTYQFYDEEMHASILSKLSLLEDMRYGLDHGQFRVLYQPKIKLDGGHLFGVEALVRWHHPVQGIISPAMFIPLAEESGLIVALGEWVLRTACAQNRAWRDAGLAPISMAVNVSARQFDDTELVAKVRRALDDSGLDASGLELEVTESLIMRDMAMSVAKMHALTAMGLSLSIDDFGTGYSSLSSLKTYPVSTLKIDKSFVSDLSNNPDDQAIARAIISLAHQLNLRVIAEGVETQEQRAFLVENGCDEMQGYLFSRPVVAAEIRMLLEQGRVQQ